MRRDGRINEELGHLRSELGRLEKIVAALTGLPNRLLVLDRLQQAMALARRNGSMLVVAYLDLDGFKAVNDCHGHQAGDRVLVEVTQRLKSVVRTSDTACRIGGDEFVVLLQGMSRASPFLMYWNVSSRFSAAPIGWMVRRVERWVRVSGLPSSPRMTVPRRCFSNTPTRRCTWPNTRAGIAVADLSSRMAKGRGSCERRSCR